MNTPVNKAIAGAIVTALVALLARFGFQADQEVTNALNVLVTAGVAAASGFLSVYLAPKNVEKK